MIRVTEWLADWPLDAGALDWLNNSYFPAQVSKVERVRTFLAFCGFSTMMPHEIRVELKSEEWNGLSGEYIPNTLPPTVKIFWPREMDSSDALYMRIMAHELIHGMALVSGEWRWIHMGHGYKINDRLVEEFNRLIDEFWPVGHWSHPGYIGK